MNILDITHTHTHTDIININIELPEDPYIRFLLKNVNSTFYIAQYVGNSGDDLISLGSAYLFEKLGLSTTLRPDLADVIVWPGGNPTMWQTNIDGWKDILRVYNDKQLLIGPATFQKASTDWEDVLNAHSQNILGVCARDDDSYDLLKACTEGLSVFKSHDPALYLRGSLWCKKQTVESSEEFILVAMRQDQEMYSRNPRLVNNFFSLLPDRLRKKLLFRLNYRGYLHKINSICGKITKNIPVRIEDVSLRNFCYFVDIVRRAKIVHTDRLHTMILASMLGKKVIAYQTSYGKLEAVYRMSLKGWAEVEFADE